MRYGFGLFIHMDLEGTHRRLNERPGMRTDIRAAGSTNKRKRNHGPTTHIEARAYSATAALRDADAVISCSCVSRLCLAIASQDAGYYSTKRPGHDSPKSPSIRSTLYTLPIRTARFASVEGIAPLLEYQTYEWLM